MEREKLESLIIDYIDGKLPEVERAALEKELVNHKELYEQFREVMRVMDQAQPMEPSGSLRMNFNKMLREEMGGPKVVSFFSPVVYRAAAAVALVLSGVALGFFINRNMQREQELAALRKEVEATKTMMISMMGNTNSASQRIEGVNVALTISKADADVIRALVKVLNEDPNTNVRLAALDALGNFYSEPVVRESVIHALGTVKDPIVQIALIQLVVKMKEKGALKDLQQIIDDDQAIKPVKDEAYSGLLKLS